MKRKDEANRADLLLGGRFLLTMDGQGTIIEGGGLAIAGDTILETGKVDDLAARYPEARFLVEPWGLIMPGLVNVHTHAAMALFRGLADDLPLMRWLEDHIFPMESRLSGGLVYHGALLSICEMIRSGTTSFCDMYLFAAEVGRAAEVAGIRAWVGEAVYDFPSPAYGAPENALSYAGDLLDRFSGHPLVTGIVTPHAVYTCAPELLSRLGELAAGRDALMQIHLAETMEELRICRERHGRAPASHLESLGLLGPRLLAAHCVWLEEEEIAMLAGHGVKVAHCPQSNLKLASGIAPVPRMMAAGLDLGLGTDGSASNNSVDMFREMNCTAKIHKAARMNSTVMDAASVLQAATLGGARALGAGERIGSLEPGKKADCIVLNFNQPHLTPLYHPVSHLVYAACGSDVIHSVINGQVVMENRQFTALDEEEILARVREASHRLRTGAR